MIKAFWYKSTNFGDQLTPVVLEWVLGESVELAHRNATGKLLGIGSIMTAIRANDIVWGSGSIRQARIDAPKGIKILALRGPLTASQITCVTPEIFGDPALLLPLIYKPDMEKKFKIGFLPHYIDKQEFNCNSRVSPGDSYILIDIQMPWQKVVEAILSCERIVTSSLHGIVACEAYGIPVIWEKGSDKIIGGEFKYQDYFLGTWRRSQQPGREAPRIENLEKIQSNLIKVLKNHYGKA